VCSTIYYCIYCTSIHRGHLYWKLVKNFHYYGVRVATCGTQITRHYIGSCLAWVYPRVFTLNTTKVCPNLYRISIQYRPIKCVATLCIKLNGIKATDGSVWPKHSRWYNTNSVVVNIK